MNFKSYGHRMVVFLIASSVILVAAAGATFAEPSDDVGEAYEAAAPPDNDDNPNVHRSASVDSDDRPLTEAERAKVGSAVAKALGSSTVTDAEVSDDRGTAFEAEALDRNGVEWDIELDASYDVVSTTKDD